MSPDVISWNVRIWSVTLKADDETSQPLGAHNVWPQPQFMAQHQESELKDIWKDYMSDVGGMSTKHHWGGQNSAVQSASCEKFQNAHKKFPRKNGTTFLMCLPLSSRQRRHCSLPQQSIVVTNPLNLTPSVLESLTMTTLRTELSPMPPSLNRISRLLDGWITLLKS